MHLSREWITGWAGTGGQQGSGYDGWQMVLIDWEGCRGQWISSLSHSSHPLLSSLEVFLLATDPVLQADWRCSRVGILQPVSGGIARHPLMLLLSSSRCLTDEPLPLHLGVLSHLPSYVKMYVSQMWMYVPAGMCGQSFSGRDFISKALRVCKL